jgi:hypothetical protein
MNEEKPLPSSKHKKLISKDMVKRLLPLVVALALLVASNSGVYLWQKGKLAASTKASQQNVDALNKQISDLKVQIKKKDDPAKPDTKTESTEPQADIQITNQLSGFHLNAQDMMSTTLPNGTPFAIYGRYYNSYDAFYIELTVQNRGKAAGYFSSNGMKLKNGTVSYDQILSANDNSATQQRFGTPQLAGKQWLKDQQLEPGETAVGMVAFKVPLDLQPPTLWYGGKTFNVKIVPTPPCVKVDATHDQC